jgi:hypothetical protein
MTRIALSLCLALLVSACQSTGTETALVPQAAKPSVMGRQLDQKWKLAGYDNQYKNRNVIVYDYVCDIKSCKTPVQASYSKLRGGKNDIDSNSFIGIVETELLPELKMSGYEKVTGPRWQIHMGHPMLMYTLHSSVERKKYKIVSVALANDALYRVDVASFDETASKNAHAEFLAAVDYSDR